MIKILYIIPFLLILWSFFLYKETAALIRGLVSFLVGIGMVVYGFFTSVMCFLYLNSDGPEGGFSTKELWGQLYIFIGGIGLVFLSMWFFKKAIYIMRENAKNDEK